MERKEYLEGWAHGFDGFEYWDYGHEDVRIFGNTALVGSENKYIVVKDGKEITGMAMYRTYVKENGQWNVYSANL